MSAAPRMTATASPAHPHSPADVKSLQARVRALTQAIQRLLATKETCTYHVANDVLYACGSLGTVRQWATRRVDTPATATEPAGVEYREMWVDVTPVPGSPAASVADALEARG